MTDAERVPGVYLVSQTDSGWNRSDRGVFHGTCKDLGRGMGYLPLCGRKFSVRPLVTRDAGRMAMRRPCTRCYGPDVKAVTVLREDRAALSEVSAE